MLFFFFNFPHLSIFSLRFIDTIQFCLLMKDHHCCHEMTQKSVKQKVLCRSLAIYGIATHAKFIFFVFLFRLTEPLSDCICRSLYVVKKLC